MQQLLTDIRTRLQEQISSVADEDVYILLEEDQLPVGFNLPALGIKDGGALFSPVDVGARRQKRIITVRVTAYVAVGSYDPPETAAFDAIALVKEVNAALNNWKLGNTYYRSIPELEEPAVAMPKPFSVWPFILRKTISLVFERMDTI